MIRHLLIALALLSVPLLAGIAWTLLPKRHPLQFEIDRETVTTVNEGDPAVVVFKAINSGNRPFIVDAVQSSCGCAKPIIDGRELIAGDLLPAKAAGAGQFVIHPRSVAGAKKYSLKITGHYQETVVPETHEMSVSLNVKAQTRVAPSEVIMSQSASGRLAYIYLFDGGLNDALQWPEPRLSDPKTMHGSYVTDEEILGNIAPDAGYRAVRAYRLEYTPGEDSEGDYLFLTFVPPSGSRDQKPTRVRVMCKKESPPLVVSPARVFLPRTFDGECYTFDVLCVLGTKMKGPPQMVDKPVGVEATFREVSSDRYICSLAVSKVNDCFRDGGEIMLGYAGSDGPTAKVTLVAGSQSPP